MQVLNCAKWDLAIVVNSHYLENSGKIVRVIASLGEQEWGNIEGLTHIWVVEIATKHGLLMYQNKQGNFNSKLGPVPDKFLRRLSPPEDLLQNDVPYHEQLQLNFSYLDQIYRPKS
jgi:hypothetical protein